MSTTDSQINDAPRSSGTTMFNAPNTSPSQGPAKESSSNDHSSSQTTEDGEDVAEEQPLESHEVIELQSFIERKAWIEQKTEFLEKLPPVEVFAGLDAVRASAETVPGLPSREQLKQWMEEHDAIEKETDVFDRGELQKLRQLTKAATQRNLSPADTDLIEITLTTIYALDKLLHLLRDRSENFELLSLRLDWEESRTAAWSDRRNIVEDLRTFLQTRASWNPSVYDNVLLPPEDMHTLTRRGSTASFASSTSGASDATLSSAKFSRSSRFKIAEVLSRDAALYSARITALRHGKIAAAGKVLDKLIDRRTVPDELLDEQDRLEEKGINDLENIGKFIMGVVMQWRKADEIYVETLKDRTAAQDLAEEIEVAKTNHPTARQSATYASRTDTLLKRLALRGNPSSPVSTFPRPENTLYEEQNDRNKSLVDFLSAEIASATEIVKKVDIQAKEYRKNYDAIKQVETLVSGAEELMTSMKALQVRLQQGVPADEGHDGDGSPPDFTSKQCLEPSRHSAFVALLPSMLTEYREISAKANQTMRDSGPAMLRLNFTGIDPTFIKNAKQAFRELSSLDRHLQEVRDDAKSQVDRLKQLRQIWQAIVDHLKEEEETREQILELMDSKRWRKISGHANGLSTPDSVRGSPLPPESSFPQLKDRLDHLSSTMLQQIHDPIELVASKLDAILRSWIVSHAMGLSKFHETTMKMTRLLEGIQRQSDAMKSADEEFHSLMLRVEAACTAAESQIRSVLDGSSAVTEKAAIEEKLQKDANDTRTALDSYIDGLPARIPIIGRHQEFTYNKSNVVKRRMLDTQILIDSQSSPVELPFDLATLDTEVRADTNYFAMQLNGKFELLSRLNTDYTTACQAKEVDQLTSGVVEAIALAEEALSALKKELDSVVEPEQKLTHLQDLSSRVTSLSEDRGLEIPRSLSPINHLIREMESRSSQNAIVAQRYNLVSDAELRFRRWQDDVGALRNSIQHAIDLEESARIARQKVLEEESQTPSPLEEAFVLQHEQTPQLGAPFSLADSRGKDSDSSTSESDANDRPLTLEDLVLTKEIKSEGPHEPRYDNKVVSPTTTVVPPRDIRSPDGIPGMNTIIHPTSFGDGPPHPPRPRTPGQTTPQRHSSPTRIPAMRGRWSPARHREGSPLASSSVVRSVQDRIRDLDLEDPFELRTSRGTPSKSRSSQLQGQISTLRKRLLSLGLNQMCRPPQPDSPLPKVQQYKKVERDFVSIKSDWSRLPDIPVDSPLRVDYVSLEQEIDLSADMVKRVEKLAQLATDIEICDAALSDLLEHIDSYPDLPIGDLASSHQSIPSAPPEEQLSARIAFTRKTTDDVCSNFARVADDTRASAEKSRLLQTWAELEEMATEKLEKKSRPGSMASSRPTSSRPGSIASNRSIQSAPAARATMKKSTYANLSAASSQKNLAVPKHPGSRRIVSNEPPPKTKATPKGLGHPSRVQSHEELSASSNTPRSVSGPLRSSLYGSTFASRQRTTSLSNSTSTPQRAATPSAPAPRPRKSITTRRGISPSPSEVSYTTRTHTRSSTSMSSWAKAPRNSLSSLFPDGKLPTPLKAQPPPPARKKYVADPKNKLDVAVGEVINNLPVGINVEGVSETWKDQSGKYWIGNQDPKLCFCRILRSQTVMVRVGGGWSELSKFIKDHFAESFRILPESPLGQGRKEEKWISSATLLERPEPATPPRPPRTPEPTMPFVPNFTFETPRRSPGSFKGSPSASGSPLTPMQFIRRADMDSLMRPVTPTKPQTLQVRNSANAKSPMRTSIWRP